MTKAALVTGAGSGIGRATSARLAELGWAVTLVDINAESGEQAAKALKGQVWFSPADVTEESAVEQVFAAHHERFGRLDGLVCAVGGARLQQIGEMGRDFFEDQIRLNLTSCFLCCRAALSLMELQGRRSIVNISSGWGFRPAPSRAAYAAAKAGIVGFTRALAAEAAPRGVRANVVAPGAIDTPRSRQLSDGDEVANDVHRSIPLARLGAPDEVAEAICYLLGDAAAYVTGQVLHVNGGAYMP